MPEHATFFHANVSGIQKAPTGCLTSRGTEPYPEFREQLMDCLSRTRKSLYNITEDLLGNTIVAKRLQAPFPAIAEKKEKDWAIVFES